MRNSLRVVLAAGLVLHLGCHAATPAEDLARIEADTAVLKARERHAEVQAQIANKQAEIANRRAEMRRAESDAGPGLPVLTAVEGIGQKLYATLELPGGSSVDVSAGDQLPDGSRVVTVRPNEVVLEGRHKRRIRLSGTAQPAPRYESSTWAGLPPLPLPPTPVMKGGRP